MSGGVASLYTAVLPVSALILAAVVLKESIGAAQEAGAACAGRDRAGAATWPKLIEA